jgi:hypothetical protein
MLLIPDENKLYITVYGRAFAITAVADTDSDANEHMRFCSGQGVIAVVKGLVLMASMNDHGRPVSRKRKASQ